MIKFYIETIILMRSTACTDNEYALKCQKYMYVNLFQLTNAIHVCSFQKIKIIGNQILYIILIPNNLNVCKRP